MSSCKVHEEISKEVLHMNLTNASLRIFISTTWLHLNIDIVTIVISGPGISSIELQIEYVTQAVPHPLERLYS
jgi:hypothetical protein